MTQIPKISAPAERALAGAGYTTLESLSGQSTAGLLSLHGFGPKGVRILNEALHAAGLDELRP